MTDNTLAAARRRDVELIVQGKSLDEAEAFFGSGHLRGPRPPRSLRCCKPSSAPTPAPMNQERPTADA